VVVAGARGKGGRRPTGTAVDTGGCVAANGGGHTLRLVRPNLKRSSKVKEPKKRAECSSEETKGEGGGAEDLLHPFSAPLARTITGEVARHCPSPVG
jgi:hypothetical protein